MKSIAKIRRARRKFSGAENGNWALNQSSIQTHLLKTTSSDWILKSNYLSYELYLKGLKKIRRMQKHIYQVNINPNKADVAILMQDQKKKI